MPCHCFVPGCKSGYDKDATEKRHFFAPPNKKHLFQQWSIAIPRQDLPLSNKSRICDLHFAADLIRKCDKFHIQGEKVELPRVRWSLQPGAVPHIFPSLPKHRKKNPAKRRSRRRQYPVIPTMSYDLDSVCRLCTKEDGNLHPIFVEANNLCPKIKDISPKLQLCDGDGLPAQVCDKCLQQVEMCHSFRLQCEQSDTVLRRYFTSSNSEDLSVKSVAISAVDSGEEPIVVKEELLTCVLEDVKQEPFAKNVPECRKESAPEDTEEESQELREVVTLKSKDAQIASSEIKQEVIAFASELNEVLDTCNDTESIEHSFDGNKVNVPDFEEKICDTNSLEDMSCETYSEIFTSEESQEQRKCSTPYRCLICMEVLPNEGDLCAHMLMHDNEPCRLCGKKFGNKSYYMRHLRGHSGLGFKCKYCNKIYSSSSAFNIHFRIHTGEKPYVCELCGESFMRSQRYSLHLMKHTDERPFECPTCLKRFSGKITLQNHIRIHTGEKPYVCEICGNSYRDQSGLWCHRKNNHMRKERKFKCSFCPKVYMDSRALVVHTRKHTGERPYMCEVCGKAFTAKDILTKHMRVHSSEKSYDCTVCQRTFSSSSSRDRHVRTHTGEMPFGCATCDKAFSLRRGLVNHIIKFQH